jgi:hypothetical protein
LLKELGIEGLLLLFYLLEKIKRIFEIDPSLLRFVNIQARLPKFEMKMSEFRVFVANDI